MKKAMEEEERAKKAQSVLKANDDDEIETKILDMIKEEKIPAGGIADFIYTDVELNVLEDQELEQVFGASGIAQFKKIGKKKFSSYKFSNSKKYMTASEIHILLQKEFQ